MKIRLVCLALLMAATAVGASRTVVVLRGGSVIELKEPWVQKGSNAILTRVDGTIFSVPLSEIDLAATAALSKAPPPTPVAAVTPPPETPAEAARARREGPKARVRITDADVGHQPLGQEEAAKEEESASPASGPARLEVADYNQLKSGNQLSIRGTLRNVGQAKASSARLTVSALDEKGAVIAKGDASLSSPTIEPGQDASFSVSLLAGDKNVGSIRFRPMWVGAPEAAPARAGSGTPGASGTSEPGATAPAAPTPPRAATPAPPEPTPYGRGSLYAPPAASAPSSAPADGKSGYIPGAARKEDQPKPPQ